MVLENSGSVARDHLASERTFLAYVRTSMALASMGVALVQLFSIAEYTSRATGTEVYAAARRVQRFSRPLGGLTIAFSFAVLLIGLWRYFKTQFTLPVGKFAIARISTTFIAFVLTAILVAIFGALMAPS
ncbi:hypothetical protein EST38_g8113 [Candolleomyces aberdarensis]|uniref:DUF202 domain-containing protein n=1 Tax=Candolleomyces aberdarensis TaxID=2316362 RepID=A0A4Q2DDF7_9AGAR|nr:hypothetical protein EST38_g8113 [Candolleomyces aberdarensis]